MEYRALTDEELAWQIAREMEAEEIAREQRDAEFAHRLQGELDSYHEPPKTPSYEPDLRNAPPVSLATRSEWPEISATSKGSDRYPCPMCEISLPLDTLEEHVEDCIRIASKKDELRLSRGKKPKPKAPQEYDPVTFEEFECPICMDDVNPGAGYAYEKCGHRYCGVCLEGYYNELIAKAEVENISCPHPGCDSRVSEFDLQYILAPEMYQKYTVFLRNARINKDPTMRWCPSPGCEQAVKRRDEDNLLMRCSECETEFCYNCSKDFHPGKTCQEASKFSLFGNDGLRNRVWKAFNTKPCPNCTAPIAKTSGCNHMTCTSCHYEFCWLCKKKYTSDHFSSSACTMYGSVIHPFGIMKRIGRLPFQIAGKLMGGDSD